MVLPVRTYAGHTPSQFIVCDELRPYFQALGFFGGAWQICVLIHLRLSLPFLLERTVIHQLKMLTHSPDHSFQPLSDLLLHPVDLGAITRLLRPSGFVVNCREQRFNRPKFM